VVFKSRGIYVITSTFFNVFFKPKSRDFYFFGMFRTFSQIMDETTHRIRETRPAMMDQSCITEASFTFSSTRFSWLLG